MRCLPILALLPILPCRLEAQAPATPAAQPQMVDPAIDDAPGPFSYYSRPTDAIGIMDGRGTEVTPEGYLYTGYGELMFLAGPTLDPVRQRIRTLRDGWLPVVEYEVRRGDVAYGFTLFATTLDGAPESPVVDFVRVTMTNTGTAAARARLAFAARYTGPSTSGSATGDNRFRRPASAQRLGQYEQPGVPFDTAWTYGFADGAFLRGGKAFYLFPAVPAPELRLALGAAGSVSGTVAPARLGVQQTTPVGVAVFDTVLAPGASHALVAKLPYAPVAPDDPFLARVRAASFDDYLARTESFWRDVAARGMQIALPERKVVDAWRASLVYDLMARDKRGDAYVQAVNQFHYHAFWLRDASFITRAYDVTGYPAVAAQVLDFFGGWQQTDGNFVSQGGQYDGWGQALWAYGQHFRLTRDTAFAARVFPAVQRAVAWLHAARAADALHLVPSTTPGDNEDITGHVTGHDFWALAGLHGAISLADGLGRKADGDAFRREYASLRGALVVALVRATGVTRGYIQPGLDARGGQDWGNMMAVYPERVLDPHDPMVTATLDSTRAKYAEGIMTYGDRSWLHDYLTMKNTETEVIRGDQQLALGELYAVLLHTSATHAGFEYDVRPWGDRDFHHNLAPHGWFAACYRTLLRDMLVREADTDLHLLSVVSPAWLAPGDSIVVRGAPTDFGPVDFRLDVTGDSGATLQIAPRFWRPPARVVVHVPWFVAVREAKADGRAVRVENGAVALAAGARTLELRWSRRGDTSAASYDATVRSYRAEYRRRWERWIGGGSSLTPAREP
ncbi:MAG TPA: hypothetical protein VMF70_10355 [Gemmatimonadales bacterium]|nr:hypothetical protein [Gemmatimonadales bacterium]